MSRRNLLKRSIVIPSLASVAVWKTPILNAVILPSHAQTSCAAINSTLIQISDEQGFNFEISNNCITSIVSSSSDSADLFIELVATNIIGAVAAAEISMNYNQNSVPIVHNFLPDSQTNNIPFIIGLDSFSQDVGVSLELNYFSTTATLEVRVLIS